MPAHVDGSAQRDRDIHALLLHLELAEADAGDIQKIIHKADQMLDLSIHRDKQAIEGRPERAGAAQDVQTVANRRERVTQLMAKLSQEFDLPPVRLG
ncbi:hypothetical protein DSM21852_11390 [Methylocystis bryophila]|nr:hypothetical protein DSM21852_11390 [Methylocystis bryophila]